MKFEYDDIFKISVRAMQISESHPSVKRDIKWLSKFLFFHGIFTVVFFLFIYNIAQNVKNKDFDEACKNGVLSVVFFVITFQYSIMLWKQDILLNLMTLIKNDYKFAENLTDDQQYIIDKYARMGTYVCKQWLAIPAAASGVFPLKNVILLTYYWWIGEPKLVPLMDLVYPEPIENNKKNIFVYFALYAVVLYYGTYASFMYASFVPLGPSFMLHACGQLEIVERQIDVLFQGDLHEVEGRLKVIVKQLQYIYSFVEQIVLAFGVAYELTLKATAIILPVACYEVIETLKKGNISLEFITFIIGGVVISSSPCYYSDLLMEKGESVRQALYSCGWESVYNRSIRSTIVMVLTRALKPIAIRTLFRTLCLDALTDVFQQSYAIFNLMNAVME